LAAKFIIIAIVISIFLGSMGTFYSNYALNFLGIPEISIPSIDKTEDKIEQTKSLPVSIVTNQLRYTLSEVKEIGFGINGEKPLEGGIFLLTKVEIENMGKNEVVIYGQNWQIRDKHDRVYTPKTFDAQPENNEKIFSIRIPPGFKITKTVGFEIPLGLEHPRDLYVADRGFESKPIFLGVT
jgi:hypothetical protein